MAIASDAVRDEQAATRPAAASGADAGTRIGWSHHAACPALAARLRLPLVTFDHKLGKAALRHLGSLE